MATLVRRRADRPTRRAVLYVHGFNDYFFQTHLADFFAGLGWDFYALDLRKYGRSLRPHQTPNFARSMAEFDKWGDYTEAKEAMFFFPELDESVRIIREQDGHDQLLVSEHSTGGLLVFLHGTKARLSLLHRQSRDSRYVTGLGIRRARSAAEEDAVDRKRLHRRVTVLRQQVGEPTSTIRSSCSQIPDRSRSSLLSQPV